MHDQYRSRTRKMCWYIINCPCKGWEWVKTCTECQIMIFLDPYIHSYPWKFLLNISEVTNFVAATSKLWKIIYQSYETYLSVRMEASRNLTWKKCKNFRIILSLQDINNKLMSSIQNNKVFIKKIWNRHHLYKEFFADSLLLNSRLVIYVTREWLSYVNDKR